MGGRAVDLLAAMVAGAAARAGGGHVSPAADRDARLGRPGQSGLTRPGAVARAGLDLVVREAQLAQHVGRCRCPVRGPAWPIRPGVRLIRGTGACIVTAPERGIAAHRGQRSAGGVVLVVERLGDGVHPRHRDAHSPSSSLDLRRRCGPAPSRRPGASSSSAFACRSAVVRKSADRRPAPARRSPRSSSIAREGAVPDTRDPAAVAVA